MARKKRELHRHHIRPCSRFSEGEDVDTNNIMLLDQKSHEAWHYFFGNLTIEEIHDFIDRVMKPGTKWTFRDLQKLREYIVITDHFSEVEDER